VTFASLIEAVIGRLNSAGIGYMVTGSIASSYYGEPRATRDLDIVIDPDVDSLDVLVDGLAADGFYVDRDAAHDALDRRAQFNAIGPDALKVDFMIRKRRPFSVEEFERRQPADLLGTAGFVASAEDLIVAKLEWAAESESDVQLRDVAGILAVSGDAIDVVYLRKWIKALQLEAIWDRAQDR
jgi:hypothetical protein